MVLEMNFDVSKGPACSFSACHGTYLRNGLKMLVPGDGIHLGIFKEIRWVALKWIVKVTASVVVVGGTPFDDVCDA
ncbi:hypothetical protein ACLOJK_030984 [Asimina triloba]